MHSPMLIKCLFLFSLFVCPCSSYINSKYTLQLQCTSRPVQLFVVLYIAVCGGGGGGGGVLCFIVVLFLQTTAIGCYEQVCQLHVFPS